MDLLGAIDYDFWEKAGVAVDWYGNRVIGKGTCRVHRDVFMIRNPYSSYPDCIWCYHVEMIKYGVVDCK